MPLPIQSIYLVLRRAVKALVGEIPIVCVKFIGQRSSSQNAPILDVPEEEIMGHSVSVVQVHKYFVIVNEATSYKWVRKLIKSHREVIQAKNHIQLYLI
jgi:hypothetical protein